MSNNTSKKISTQCLTFPYRYSRHLHTAKVKLITFSVNCSASNSFYFCQWHSIVCPDLKYGKLFLLSVLYLIIITRCEQSCLPAITHINPSFHLPTIGTLYQIQINLLLCFLPPHRSCFQPTLLIHLLNTPLCQHFSMAPYYCLEDESESSPLLNTETLQNLI